MSRCWDVANFCPLVVFVAGVRVVEFGSKQCGVIDASTEMLSARLDSKHVCVLRAGFFNTRCKIILQESRAVARKPRDAAAVLFALKFADDIHYNFTGRQHSSAMQTLY